MKSRRAASIAIVLSLVTILAFLAAAMSALFLFNVNFAQGSFNGQTAFSQAEAGLQEVIYRISQDPTLELGRNGAEEFTGSVAREFNQKESYYRVTFKQGTGFPHSTNNVKGDHKTGYLGRTIPDGCLHLFSTGFCRGQYRTIEAVVRQPSCPFGIATSGKLYSKTPIIVEGTTSSADFQAGKTDRPGHIACNSPQGVVIEKGSNPALSTKITGFIKSSGPIVVDQPAEVWGGLRPNSSSTEFPKFDFAKLDPKYQGLVGVVDLPKLVYPAQNLDVVYRADHDLRFDGPVTLHEAYVYVKGNVVITGGLRGIGSLVVDGNVTIGGGVDLSGSNQVALIASGKVDLKGGGNYFIGYLYSASKIVAENITVVGAMIVNSPDPDQGGAELDRVTVISDEKAGQLQFTTNYYEKGESQPDDGEANYFWMKKGDNKGGDKPTAIEPNSPQRTEKLTFVLTGGNDTLGKSEIESARALANTNFQSRYDPVMTNKPPSGAPNIGDVELAYNSYVKAISTAVTSYDAAQAVIDSSTSSPDEVAAAKSQQATAEAEIKSAYASYKSVVDDFVKRYWAYVDSHSNPNGTFRLRDGAPPTDQSSKFEFDLNRYLPTSDRLQMTYWHVTPRRL